MLSCQKVRLAMGNYGKRGKYGHSSWLMQWHFTRLRELWAATLQAARFLFIFLPLPIVAQSITPIPIPCPVSVPVPILIPIVILIHANGRILILINVSCVHS